MGEVVTTQRNNLQLPCCHTRYMYESHETPSKILLDSPHARIIFSLRDPVARAWSDYRYMFRDYRIANIGFQKVVTKSVKFLRGANCFPDDGEKLAALAEILPRPFSDFYGKCRSKFDPNDIIKKGMYFFMVSHWMYAFKDVFVLTTADLEQDPLTVFQDILAFTQLCPFDFDAKQLMKRDHVTNKEESNVPMKLRIDNSSRAELHSFYSPYSKLLNRLVQRDLGFSGV